MTLRGRLKEHKELCEYRIVDCEFCSSSICFQELKVERKMKEKSPKLLLLESLRTLRIDVSSMSQRLRIAYAEEHNTSAYITLPKYNCFM